MTRNKSSKILRKGGFKSSQNSKWTGGHLLVSGHMHEKCRHFVFPKKVLRFRIGFELGLG